MPEWLENLLRLQNIDLAIAQCNDILGSFQRRTADAHADLNAKMAVVEDGKKRLMALETTRRQTETEIAALRTTKGNFQAKTALIKSNDEYRAALIQIEQCDKTIAEKEEEVLNLMLEIEEAQTAYKELQEVFAGQKVDFEKLCQSYNQEKAEAEALLARQLAQQAEAEAAVDPAILPRYKRLRSAKNYPKTSPVVVPLIANGACGRCHLISTKQMQTDAHKGKLVYCGSCGAILYEGTL